MSGFMNFLFGSGPKQENISRLSGGQEQLLNNLMQGIQGQGPMSSMFSSDPQMFEDSFVNPLMNQFENRTAPAIQQKFIASGAGRGSNVQDSLTRAGADVQGQLNQQLANLIQQSQNRAMQGAQLGLGTQAFNTMQVPGQTGIVPELLSGVAGGFAKPAGEALAGGVSSLFQRQGQQR